MPFRSFPLTTRLTLVVFIPLSVLALWILLQLRASLPPDGTITLQHGVTGITTISRNAQGIVNIRAQRDTDAFFAIGYAHAQDRLWQLELQRRMARGRLSEVFGEESIPVDAWFRTLGIYASTASAWTSLSPDAQASLRAYTAGINAWLKEGHTLPVEFRTLGITPELWTERDSLAWVKVFALDLSGNFEREIRHYLALQTMSASQVATFFPDYPTDAPTTITTPKPNAATSMAALLGTQQRLQRDFGLSVPGTGSNAWAVSGIHTKDGAALLANDPHLGLRIPSLWYAISVDTPQLKASGMGLVGLPLVVLGRNDRIAWGGTNMMADAQDLFFEHIDTDGTRYSANGQWLPFDTREESITVRPKFPQALRKQYAPLRITIRSTRHGPVISDRYGMFEQPVSLRWTALDKDDTSYEAFFRMNYARDWATFTAALRHHVAPAMNMVYADRDGNIGYLGAGRIPIRRRGEGTLPSTGWSDASGWSGSVPPTEWPSTFNPASGIIVTANNKVADGTYPHFISHDWAPPARAQRIEQLLRQSILAGKPLTLDDMGKIQADTRDLSASALMDYLRSRLPKGGHRDTAARYLREWHGDMRADSSGATIFQAWMLHVRQSLFESRLRADWGKESTSEMLSELSDNVEYDDLLAILRDGRGSWCSRPSHCEKLLASALDSALWELHKRNGDWSMKSWNWGDNQFTQYAHMPFSQSKALAFIFERRIGNGGSANSINVAASKYHGSEGYLQTFGPGFRQIFALDKTGIRHAYLNSTGQSGNVFSPHYDDMIESFHDLRFFKLVATYDAVEAQVKHASAAPEAHIGDGASR
jgi:penicillin G amidase